MYEKFINNIFFKSILVVVIGVFIFDIFFGFLTGSEDYYSYKGLINGMLVLLIKLLIVLFLIIVIAVLTRWLKEVCIENINTGAFGRIINIPAFKLSIITAAFLIGIIFLFKFLSGFMITNNGMNMAGMNRGHYNGVNFGINMASLITLFINIAMCILIFTLILGAFMYLKEQYANQNIKSEMNKNSNLNKIISSENNKND